MMQKSMILAESSPSILREGRTNHASISFKVCNIVCIPFRYLLSLLRRSELIDKTAVEKMFCAPVNESFT